MTYSKALVLIALFACISTALAGYKVGSTHYHYGKTKPRVIVKPDLDTYSKGVIYGDAYGNGKIWMKQKDISYVNDYNPNAGSSTSQDLYMYGGHAGYGGVKHATAAELDHDYLYHEMGAKEYGYTDVYGAGGMKAGVYTDGYSKANPYATASGHTTVADAYGGKYVSLKSAGGSHAYSGKEYN